MAGVGLVALDGTKMAAPASMQCNVTKDTIDETVEKMFAEVKDADESEDATFSEIRGDEPPAVLRGREDRRRRFKAAKEILDNELDAERAAHEAYLAERAQEEERQGHKLRGRKPKPSQEKAGHKDKKVNTTDPCSKVMSTKNGFLQGYNAQAVANEDQVVVSAEVTEEQNDKAQLHPMIDATNESLEKAGIADRPGKLLADAGYASEENFAALDADDPDSYVAVRNMEENPSRRTGRRGPLKKDATLIDKMDRKVSNKLGRDLYKRRQAIIEPVFGQINDARGIRSFMRRGKPAADSEWKLICGTHNLLKLYRRALAKPDTVPFSRLAASVAG